MTTSKSFEKTSDLSLCATKETAKAIKRYMAGLVATKRHLWFTLSEIKKKDRLFLLDVVDRFQEACKHVAAFQRFLSRFSLAYGAAEWEQPQPCACSSYREVEKLSVTTRTPQLGEWGSQGKQHSQMKASKPKADLRTVLLTKKSSTKKP